MNRDAFGKLYWGFLFVMLDFKIQGFDILPDIVGYAFFAFGFSALLLKSLHFKTAKDLNVVMLILSIFSIYEPSVQDGTNPLGLLGIIIGIASAVLNLLIVYNLFMGIKDMAREQGRIYIVEEAGKRWNQYLIIAVSGICSFVFIFALPLFALFVFALFIFSIIVAIAIMNFMKRCGLEL